ncbi:MAG: hypothetical protein ACPICH_06555, partial [Poseidonia sp.]
VGDQHEAEGEVNVPPDVVPIFAHAHPSFCFDLYSSNFFWNSSSVRPCHPLHRPVGERPHPHFAMLFFLLDRSIHPLY